MALKINKTFGNGIVAPDCYSKIIRTDYTVAEYPEPTTGTRLIVAFYFNAAARTANDNNFIEVKEYAMPDYSQELRADQYTYLKTLPEFSGAIDV